MPMGDGIEICRAVAADGDGYLRVYMESAKHHARIDPERYLLPEEKVVRARFEERLRMAEAGEGVTLTAMREGQVVGFADAQLQRSHDQMHRELLYCYVAEIAVAPELQSKGIGARLLAAAEEWGRQQGAEYASLEYNAANVRAEAFYRERMGYSPASVLAIKRLG